MARPYQAADVYNATHDLALYEWVAGLEAKVQRYEAAVRDFWVYIDGAPILDLRPDTEGEQDGF